MISGCEVDVFIPCLIFVDDFVGDFVGVVFISLAYLFWGRSVAFVGGFHR